MNVSKEFEHAQKELLKSHGKMNMPWERVIPSVISTRHENMNMPREHILPTGTSKCHGNNEQ